MTKRFENKVVAITGAAGGMGLAFARHFAAEGATLILTDVDKAGLAEAAATLAKQGALLDACRRSCCRKRNPQFAAEFAAQQSAWTCSSTMPGSPMAKSAFSFESLSQVAVAALSIGEHGGATCSWRRHCADRWREQKVRC